MHFTRHGSDLAYIIFQNLHEQIDNVKSKTQLFEFMWTSITKIRGDKKFYWFLFKCILYNKLQHCIYNNNNNNNNPSLCFLEAKLRNWSLSLVVWRQDPCYYCFWNKSTLVKELVASPRKATLSDDNFCEPLHTTHARTLCALPGLSDELRPLSAAMSGVSEQEKESSHWSKSASF